MLYVGGKFTVAAEGHITRRVLCEKCQTLYGYVKSARALGSGRSPYFVDNDGAKRRAMAHAQANLQATLQMGNEIIPCPACGWVQQYMAEVWRAGLYPWMGTVATVAFAIGGAALTIGVLAVLGIGARSWWPVVAIGIAILAIGPALLVYRGRRRRAFDANLNYTARAGRASAGVFIIPVAQAQPVPNGPPQVAWFYQVDGRREGPVTESDLKKLAANGGITPADLVWNDAMDDWAPASSVFDFAFF